MILQHSVINKTLLLIFLFFLLITCKKEQQLPDPLAAGWNGETICELLEETNELRVLKCTFKPNYGHEKHFHKPHFGYALSGSRFRIQDTTGTREVDLRTGSYFTSEGTDWHIVKNIGDSTAVYLIFEPKR